MTTPETHRISIKSILFGLLLMPLCVYLVALEEMIWHSLHWTSMSLPQLSIFFLFVFCSTKLSVGSYRENYSLRLNCWRSTLPFQRPQRSRLTNNMACMMGVIPHAFFYATLENDWANFLRKNHGMQLAPSRCNFICSWLDSPFWFRWISLFRPGSSS